MFEQSIKMVLNPNNLTSTVKPVLSGHSKRRPKLIFKTAYRLMQVKSILQTAILSIFIKLPFVIKIFVLSILSDLLRQVLLYSISII